MYTQIRLFKRCPKNYIVVARRDVALSKTIVELVHSNTIAAFRCRFLEVVYLFRRVSCL